MTRRSSSRRRARTAARVAAGLALVVLAAACGSSGTGGTDQAGTPGDPRAAAAVRHAVTATTATTTRSVTSTLVLSGALHATLRSRAVLDRPRSLSRVTITGGGAAATRVVDGTTLWMRTPTRPRWTRIATTADVATGAPAVFSPGSVQLTMLDESAASLHVYGTATPGDVSPGGNAASPGTASSTRYAGTVTWQRVLHAALSAGLLTQHRANELSQGTATGSSSIGAVVDAERRVRSISARTSLHLADGTVTLSLATHYAAFGAAVAVETPLPSNVADHESVASVRDLQTLMASLIGHTGAT